MSDNPRDTQFSGFAKLLWGDILAKIATIEMSPDEWIDGCQMCTKVDEVTALIEPLIAERADELVRQSCIAINNEQMKSGGVRLHPNAMLRAVPDMTEWPKADG